ncbi:MAG: hypothetical protein KIT83_06120 [Bryobacterales bacterium]|nr:hypothetical protein [Bryobacterales bacterium]
MTRSQMQQAGFIQPGAPVRLPDGTPLPPMFQGGIPPSLQTKPATYHPSQLRWKAMRFTGQGLTPTFMVEKINQDFARFATPFEEEYSKLVHGVKHSGPRTMEPVVDGLTVIGHVGKINARRLWIPIGVNGNLGMDTALELGIPVYVSRKNPDLNFWFEFGASEVNYQVLTGIDGEVVAALSVDYVGLEQSDFWLLDAVLLGRGLANLGVAVGRKLLSSLSRRAIGKGGAVSFHGATKEIAKEALERTGARTASRAAGGQYIRQSGMTEPHFNAFRETARKQNVIALVRDTNPASTELIRKGCPGKPLSIKFHTDQRTGVVMATAPADLKRAHELRYFVVDADGVARRPIPGKVLNGKPVMEELRIDGAFWKVEKGQVIDPALKKPVVGDYDLMGVVDPSAPGRNIALHAIKEEAPADISSPIVARFAKGVNEKLDMPRVLHGAQDQFAGFRGGATAFMPDGSVKHLADEAAVQSFYKEIGRETIKGSYPKPPSPLLVVDELAARRGQPSR